MKQIAGQRQTGIRTLLFVEKNALMQRYWYQSAFAQTGRTNGWDPQQPGTVGCKTKGGIFVL